MKRITSIILLISSNVILSQQITDQFWGANQDGDSSLLNRIHTNHYFSMTSNSSNGSSDTYGLYGNSTYFNLNSKTRIYGDFSIMHPLSGYPYSDKLNYSVSLGLNYKLNNSTSLSLAFTTLNYPSLHSVGLQNRNLP